MKIKPMLCLKSQPFNDTNYLFERKWNGERAIITLDGDISIQSREGEIITFRYPEFKDLRKGLQCKRAVLDGEICVIDKDGKTNFNLIAQRSHLENKFQIELRSKKIPATFVAFDILYEDEKSVMPKPLIERKELLYKNFIPDGLRSMWSLPLDREGRGISLFEQAKIFGFEGIVGKYLYSPYIEDNRSAYWKKCKCKSKKEILFISYKVNPAGIRVEDENGIAIQISNRRDSKTVMEKIDALGKCLVVVEYLEETKNGKLFQPVYKGMVKNEMS
jgi:ATP-dependent DNA ligase